ncbi:hypothetical protein TK78_24505 [Streptomyces sp. Tue 6075]|uniref:AraC family transcriptional regulator n=1 Tax=Streptomyces sp. Tue 6075 TaxID=1661694 RepID=UPI00094A89B7|nr:AraC family transcriptional regulator [Streptomyces sp. Tue 6075]APS21729.1 hypothetical protein TK78_24505 [Streptomyces sp. Tue 6075]
MRFVLESAVSLGADVHRVMREAAVRPREDGASEDVATRDMLRLWELIARDLGDPCAALRIGADHRQGLLGLHDYLISTSESLGDALDVHNTYLPLLTDSCRFVVAPEEGGHVSVTCEVLGSPDAVSDASAQFVLSATYRRFSQGIEGALPLAGVTFRQRAPRSVGLFAETFGTRAVGFDEPADQLVFPDRYLAAPMRGADPHLAQLLRGYAEDAVGTARGIPEVEDSAPQWYLDFRDETRRAVRSGGGSLSLVARRLSLSTRTLQRRLRDHGTTWRSEVDAARQARADTLADREGWGPERLARELGYSDAGTYLRARRRWNTGRGGAE